MRMLDNDEYLALKGADDRAKAFQEECIELREQLGIATSPRWADRLIARVSRRPPDFIIGGQDRPYIRRWWLTPWRAWTERAKKDPRGWMRRLAKAAELLPNAYLHNILRSDDDRAHHDHPWLFNISLVLRGDIAEVTIAAGGIATRIVRHAGQWKLRLGASPHRLEIVNGACWTLFVTGPRSREWGFHCDRGWVHWKVFTATDDRGAIGRGCE